MLDVEFYGHACILLTHAGVSVATDPWLGDRGAFLGSWWPFPRVDDLDLSSIRSANYIYISHAHLDHFDVPFLQTCENSAIALICDFPHKAFRDRVQALGFADVIELPAGKSVPLEGGIVATAIPADSLYWQDSALLLQVGEHAVWQSNDLKYSMAQAHFIRELTGGGPLLQFGQYSGANWHPMVYDYPHAHKVEIAQRKRANKVNLFLRQAAQTGSKNVIPCAGPPCFLDDALFELNFSRASIFPNQMDLERALEHIPHAFNLIHMLPGDRLTVDDDGTVHPPDNRTALDALFSDLRGYLQQYRADKRTTLERIAAEVPPARAALFEQFQRTFQALVSSSAYFRDKIAMRVCFDISGPCGGRWIVDWRRPKHSVFVDDGAPCGYTLGLSDRHLQLILDGRLGWEDFFLSLRFSASRQPDRYNEHLFSLLKFADPKFTRAQEASFKSIDNTEFFDVDIAGTPCRVQRYCPHAGEDLSKEPIEDGILTCPRHGWRFELPSGRCLQGNHDLRVEKVPSTSAPRVPDHVTSNTGP